MPSLLGLAQHLGFHRFSGGQRVGAPRDELAHVGGVALGQHPARIAPVTPAHDMRTGQVQTIKHGLLSGST
ncbi:hypothetical protein MUN86_25625 (plasmid) [Hymenobacter volaticus]|uniref:Uncharacterized protein n=1 Tax=Hymenobacter volaticus TaxID=2932254 RepID=A0ABY4GDV9_9BACT|nr:hypothetical protein [Hymenobacter volaticus]UOQ69102.1 hypothetical protein MUN86_25625 [Hymenobacter volaticus]